LGREILDYLGECSWVSGEEMASRLGISRAAVWKQIKSLRAKGFEVESSTKKGYRLVSKPDLLDPDLLRSGLKTRCLGREIYCHIELGSTNEYARSIAAHCKDGTVILAETQTAGRGRLSRPWSSPQGGIWMSLILKPEIPLAQAYRINMAVSVALARAIYGLYGLKADIKWPNDLLINDRKLCGILMEISAEVDRLDFALIGIGLNANVDVSGFPEDWRVTSLSKELGHSVSRTKLIQRILQEVDEAYDKMSSEEIYEEWRDRSATLGRYVRITSPSGDLEGEAVALSTDGALYIETDKGIKRILAGDCIHLRALSRGS
jgi:BirA family biotin operon repressor/biotin-[acetyl-CoA-carboxylase] ligase